MGKKKYSDKGYFDRWEAAHDMADVYGADTSNVRMGSGGGRPGEGGVQRDTLEDLEAAIVTKGANDYDLRESLKDADAAGKSWASDILDNGLESIDDVYQAHKKMKKTFKNQLDGKNYESLNDKMAVSNFWANRRQEREDEKYENQYATNSDIEEIRRRLEENTRNAAPVEAPELSQTLRDAQEGIDEYSLNLGIQGNDIFGIAGSNDLEVATAETEANPASGESWEYKDNYASTVLDGIKLSGISTRGPNSLNA